MKQLKCILAAACCLLILNVQADDDIWGEDGDFMEDDSNAKVQRYIAKQRALEANMTKEQRDSANKGNSECGSVDVGNVQGSGNGDVENVVIIKGDVINANNRCR